MGGKSFKDILWKIFRFVFLGFMALALFMDFIIIIQLNSALSLEM